MATLAAPQPKRGASFNLPSSTNTSTPGTSQPPSPTDSDSDSEDDNSPLPFPAALPRSDFLRPDFQPAAYLSALPHRHQTLEDLRSDLRERSAAISSELLELVNSNYTAFLSLGTELRGGDDKVEDVKVAMLGFRRAVEDVKGKVGSKREEASRLGDELGTVRSGIEDGRRLLEVSDRLSSLEERLALDSLPASGERKGDATDSSEEEEEEDDDEKVEGLGASSPAKLSNSARQCRHITALISAMDQDHPFVIKQDERLTRCRNTLLLDLGNALREAKGAGTQGTDRVIKYLEIYRIIDAQNEAVKALQER